MGVTIPTNYSWEHMGFYSGQGPSAHSVMASVVTDLNALQVATISSADASDLSTAITLVNEIKGALNTVAAVTIGTVMAS